MLEQIRTVNQTELGSYIGTVDDESTLNAIAKALKKTYGMWFYKFFGANAAKINP